MTKYIEFGENARLGCAERTHCAKGHKFTPTSITFQIRDGYKCRRCRKCNNKYSMAGYLREKATLREFKEKV